MKMEKLQIFEVNSKINFLKIETKEKVKGIIEAKKRKF
jgi:hypothetical protein